MTNPCAPAHLPADFTGKVRNIVSVESLSKQEILTLLELAAYFEAHPNSNILEGNVAATLFFEPSTRTRLSFETAVLRLGGKVIGFSDPAVSSTSKGETLTDTIKIVSNYADIIIMRHFIEGAATLATEATKVPVINAGDGAHQHPSQTMLDLYSILKTQGRLDDITVTLVGDLKYGRTVHSMLMALKHFRVRYHFVACNELRMPEEFRNYCDKHGIEYHETTTLSPEIIADSDIIYMTRVQRERFDDLEVYEMVKDLYNLDAAMLNGVAKPTMKVLHPLPRVGEINEDVDATPHAYYFQQAKNGLFMRQAMICRAMGIEVDGIRYPEVKGEEEEFLAGYECHNPKCVTNKQQIAGKFTAVNDNTVKCHYCEWEQKK